MPPRGYRDETKALMRSIKESSRETKKSLRKINKLLAENPALGGGPEASAEYQRFLENEARELEHEARSKAAFGREPDLRHLVKISVMQDRDGISANEAAGKVADEFGGNARVRHANYKRLYSKFQKAPALYLRLALASEDPSDAADREICEALGITPRAEWEVLNRARQSDYRARLLRWAHEALKQDELARAIHAACTFKDAEEFARAYRAVRDILNSFK